MQHVATSSHTTDQAIIVSKALCRAVDFWAISNRHLGEIIGLSEATISRLKKGEYRLVPDSKSWQLALLFLRSYRGLDAYLGGHKENEIAWLNASNQALNGTPLELMKDVAGLANVTNYIDAIRGQ